MDKNSEELASRLSYEIIKEVAPDELDLFDDIKEEFQKNPNAFQKEDRKNEEKLLGFGGGVGEVFITMKVLPLIWGIVSYVGMAGIDSLKENAAKKVKKDIEEKFGRKEEHLSAEKIAEVKDYAIKKAKVLDIDEEKAGIITELIIGKLTQMRI